MHKINLRSLNLWNLFPSIPTDVTIYTDSWSLPISRGNWSAPALAKYIDYNLAKSGIATRVSWDSGLQRFTFCPGITLNSDSTANRYLGFPERWDKYSIQSEFPPQLSGPWNLHLMSNLAINNIPVSGRLASFPVNADYGSLIQYTNYDTSDASLSMDNNINSITLQIHDEDMKTLSYYPEGVDWDVCISFQLVPNAGFQPIQQ